MSMALLGTENIAGGICNAIVKAEQSNLKVGINDEGLAQLNERNDAAISAFKQALDEHEKRINALFVYQQTEFKRIRNVEKVHTSTVPPMLGCSA